MAILVKDKDKDNLYEGFNEEHLQEKGDLGEAIISAILNKYLSDAYSVLNDILVRTEEGDMTQVDHLVIHPQFAVSIETKNISGSWSAVDNDIWEKINNSGSNFKMNSPQLQSVTHTMHLESFLRDYSITVPIYALVVLVNDRSSAFMVDSDFFYQEECPVIYGKELIPYILRKEFEHSSTNSEKIDTEKVIRLILQEHNGIKESPLYLCKKAALNNDPEAQYLLGEMYLKGYFESGSFVVRVSKDEKKGINWISRSAKQGYHKAIERKRSLKK